jgi:hypothetical protein
MYRCNEDRANWYLDRNLARLVSEADGVITIQFTFTPKGNGHHGDEFFLAPQENKCVVCGSATLEDLTRHHIVPHNYRRWLPEEVKSRNHHDIVLLCFKCHREYESYAWQLKMEIANKYGVALNGCGDVIDHAMNRAKKAASAIAIHRDKMPQDAVCAKLTEIANFLGHDPSEREIEELSVARVHDMKNYKYHGMLVAQKVEDVQEFVELWRFHFLGTMKPRFMSPHWNPKRPCMDVGKGRLCTESR